jgi:hypothetical protein
LLSHRLGGIECGGAARPGAGVRGRAAGGAFRPLGCSWDG